MSVVLRAPTNPKISVPSTVYFDTREMLCALARFVDEHYAQSADESENIRSHTVYFDTREMSS